MESNNKTIINEISVGPFVKGLFTGIKNFFKGASDDVAKYASAEMGKVVQRLSKSGTKNISLQALRSSSEYKKSLSALGEDYALKTYKKSYKSLTDAEKKIVVRETTKNLDNVITKELQVTAGTIGKDIAGGLKGVKLVRSGQKTAQITKTINSLNKVTKAQAQRLITSNAKLIGDGTKGVNIVSKIKSGQITIIKNGQVYTTQTKNLANQPVKVYQLNRKTLGILAGIGVTGLVAYYLYADMKKDETIILVDEDGNSLTDEQINEWADCIQELLKSKEAILGYTPTGIARVILKNTQYPNGVAFFTNGRVANLETKERGNWRCKSGKAVVSESKKMSLLSLLNEEVGLNNIDITWDSGKDNNTTTTGSKYIDCSSYDINKQDIPFLCKSPIVKEIQKCLGLEPKYQTGNFGPITMEKLGAKVITKAKYEEIIANCGSSSNVTTSDVTNAGGGYKPKGLGKVDTSKFDYLNGTSGDSPTNPTDPTNVTSEETPEQFYNRLKNEGLIEGDDATTFYTDENGEQRSYGPSRRILYKGPNLSKEQFNNLNSVITKLGYTDRLSQVANKKYGIKYVWVKKK
jgi:hypothetical protein